MAIEVKSKNDVKRPSAAFAALYRFHSFLDIRTRFREALDDRGLKCLTINLSQRVIKVWYERESPIRNGFRIYGECCLHISGPNKGYAKLIPCNADHALPVSASGFPGTTDPQIFIYLKSIEDGLGRTIGRLSKELNISKKASEALVESIIIAHEVQHCLINTALLFIVTYSFGEDVDFADSMCVEYLSEELVDHTLMRTLPMTFKSLGIEPSLFKSAYVLNLLNSLKSSGDITLSDLDIVAKYIAKNFWNLQSMIYAIHDGEVRKLLNEVWKRLLMSGGAEAEAKRILRKLLRNRTISTKRLVSVLESDVSDFNEFVKNIDTSRYRVLDKACTALRLNISKLLYFWDKGMIDKFIEALLGMGVLRRVEPQDLVAKKYKYVEVAQVLDDLKVFEELRDAKIRNVVPDLKSYIERIVFASSASGMVKTFYWNFDPKDPVTTILKDIKPLTRVTDKRKVKSALIINVPIIEGFFDYGVVREIKRRLKELSITVYEINDISEKPPFSSYVFFITSTWNDAEVFAQKLYRTWLREIALSVLIAYPDAPFPSEKVLKSWKRVSKYLYFVSLYDFDNLSLSRVYSYKEALSAAKRGSF